MSGHSAPQSARETSVAGVCLVTRDPIVLFAAKSAAAEAGFVLQSQPTCSRCQGSCRSVVAFDLSHPDGFSFIDQTVSGCGARVLVAIAPEHMTVRALKDRGFHLIVYRPLIDRFFTPVLKLAASLLV